MEILLKLQKQAMEAQTALSTKDKLGLEKIYIQAKRYNENKVREKDIRNFIGAMSGDTKKGRFCYNINF